MSAAPVDDPGRVPAVVEDWLRCPSCGSERFTSEPAPYGIELACWRCPTYLGVRLATGPAPVDVLASSPRVRWRWPIGRPSRRARLAALVLVELAALVVSVDATVYVAMSAASSSTTARASSSSAARPSAAIMPAPRPSPVVIPAGMVPTWDGGR